MEKRSLKTIADFKIDARARKRFEKSAHRFRGVGLLLIVIGSAMLWRDGMQSSNQHIIGLFGLIFIGFLVEQLLVQRAKLKNPKCPSCNAVYKQYINSDRPEDTQYLYVCTSCKTYFSQMHAEKQRD